ncbi:MAG: hypothetical protein INQ03_01900 [Candidatus Heimdallarchaeota archaeon]|nr:hypothetical protein [Candidatus Heimdallarchaeota archaeon]
MSQKYKFFCLDTNFFITSFSENPASYEQFNKVLNRMKIKIIIADYVQKEMRWYMRRSIEPFLTIKPVNPAKLKKYEDEARGKVTKGLPQTPDMAVAYLAEQEGIPIVSSDWRLVEVGQELGLDALMNSAFVVMLLEEVENDTDRAYLKELYEIIIEDEIRHSVKSQGKYDPVIRIQKIMDSAMSVIKKQTIVEAKEEKIIENYDFPSYKQLFEVTRRIRTDLSEYISMIEMGQYKRVIFELNEGMKQLRDLLLETRFKEVPSTDELVQEAYTTLGHILLLSSTVALDEQRLNDAISLIDQLALLSGNNPQLEERLDIEIHLQRLTIIFLTEQYSRFNIYFTPEFMELCIKRERQDILLLHRTMGIIVAVLSNKKVEDTAQARDFSEIQYLIQLGVQFITMGNVENAWLLLLQAVHMSINSDMTGLLLAVFEIILPLSFLNNTFDPSFSQILGIVKKKVSSFPYQEYEKRSHRNLTVDDKLIRSRAVDTQKIPNSFQGFLDVISSEFADFKKIGRCSFVRVIDWNTMHFIGIVDPTLSLDENLTVGCSIKLQEGKMRVISPSASIKSNRQVDVLIICKPEDLKFVVRRAGKVQVAQSRVGEYDL